MNPNANSSLRLTGKWPMQGGKAPHRITRTGIINRKTPDKSGFVSLGGWEVPIPSLHGWHWNLSQLKCYPGLGEGSCSFCWGFYNTSSHGVLSNPECTGSQSIMGCTRHQTPPLAEQSGCDCRPESPGTHVGLICCTSWAQLEVKPAAPDSHQKHSCLREKQAVRFPKITWILPVKPTLHSSSSIQMTTFLFKFAFSKSQITGVSRALLEPFRIAFIFVFSFNLKSK